ncbi:hypothetical protein HZQ19_16275 [Elizabethkingia anophelis]|uniref:hypothetical protein n=1 Tax=Elizabethkingia anophelis TaxID=1117645 RepID=UPI000C9BD040|nr:hypothetical protein [Elizabethkingia anophelis]MCT3759522.1 hypothetical protein [Elizabethkingia anophelis]MCT3974182.1 hypothetical protein [Elizabethkingia anophelis]MCT4003417.1 hypothetical protein [Elizabethkingia anophelis]MCT4017436.1 hypothetical protein [Elizabethkingia anophelis]MCT4020998.1 hypothetical protein [Elizabethkingia anophelis]
MKSDKLENYIKNQLEKREINPSRNLWADIRLDLDEAPKKNKKNTVIWLAAASVILLCSVAGIFIFKNDRQNRNPIIAKQTQPVNSSEPKEISTPETNIKTDSVLRKESPVQNLAQQQPAPAKAEKTPKQKTLPKTIITPVEKIDAAIPVPQNQLVKTEETKEQTVKKKKYVDPKILLFSVENREAIEKTKDGSNVASVEIRR